VLGFFDQTTLVKYLGRDLVPCIEIAFNAGKADLDPLLFEDVGKSTLWQAALERHLSTLESGAAAVTGTRLLAFVSAAGSFAEPGAGTASDPLFLMRRTLGGMQVV
jgi:hypothetical protein